MKAQRAIWTSLAAVLAVAIGPTLGAAGPAKINYQGVLRDAAGKPRSGSFDMDFRFFDAASGGNEILVDRHEAAGTGAVVVTTGLFNAVLGGGTVEDGAGPGTFASLKDVFGQFGTVYLEVTVAGETLSPRTQVLSSAFAIANAGPDGPCYDNANRFVDCNNGTVTDSSTGLIWLKNGNCFGLKSFADANNAASALHSGQCGLADGSSAGAWRLPSQTEWNTIVKSSCYPTPGGPTIPDTVGTGCYPTGAQWGTDVQADFYWTSTTDPDFPDNAWLADLLRGFPVNGDLKISGYFVWPVRGGSK